VAIKFEPREPDTGFVFRSEIKGGAGEALLLDSQLFAWLHICAAHAEGGIRALHL
jgi:hypothetical protein